MAGVASLAYLGQALGQEYKGPRKGRMCSRSPGGPATNQRRPSPSRSSPSLTRLSLALSRRQSTHQDAQVVRLGISKKLSQTRHE